jgi:hypothetical protein
VREWELFGYFLHFSDLCSRLFRISIILAADARSAMAIIIGPASSSIFDLIGGWLPRRSSQLHRQIGSSHLAFLSPSIPSTSASKRRS